MFTRKHKLRLEPLEHRYLLSTTMDYSTFLTGRAVMDATTDPDGYVYALLADDNEVVKLNPGPDLAADPFKCPALQDPQLCWSRTLTGLPVGGAIAVDGSSVYVTGQSVDGFQAIIDELSWPFGGGSIPRPTTGTRDAFVAKLSQNDGTPEYATYLSGNQNETGTGIAVDANGTIYVSGTTGNDDTFPTTDGPLAQGVNEAFVAKVIPELNLPGVSETGPAQLEYSALLSGSDDDFATDLALTDCVSGANCSVVVAGRTSSNNFSGLGNTAVGEDAFVVQVTPTPGTFNVSGTFLGGGADDQASAVAIDPNGDVFVTGTTDSANFPTVNGYQKELAGNTDAFLVRLDSDLNPTYSTFLGGSREDKSHDVAVDAVGVAYLTGKTLSTNFPLQNPIDDVDIPYSGNSRTGKSDAFVARLDTNLGGDELIDSTYLGGSKDETGGSIVLAGSDTVWVGGMTNSSNFPITTSTALDFIHDGGGGPEAGNDPFLTKLGFQPPPPPSISINDVSVTEGNSGPINAVFTVTLSDTMNEAVTVTYSTSDGSPDPGWATAGIDYEATSGTLIIDPAVSLSGTITVSVYGDTDEEGDEAFFVDLTSATGVDSGGVVPITVNQGVGTILGDDGPVGTTVHVGDLDGESFDAPRNKWDAEVTVEVHAELHGTVQGALVQGSWSAGASGSGECTTEGDGRCIIRKNNIKGNNDSVTFTVNAVTLDPNTYNAGDNHEPDGDSNGTTITVSQGAGLRLAGDAAESTSVGKMLTEQTLGPAVEQAIGVWTAADVDPQRLADLNQVDVRIGDLDGTLLGRASAGSLLIDRDAAGHGWSTDPDASQAPQLDGVDLLSTLVHELGHVLGFDHDVMGTTLDVGERDLSYLDDLFADTSSWEQAYQPGDANGDGRFDQLDLVAVLQAGKYLTGQSADWSQGDWDGSGVFDQLDVIVALQSGRYAT